MPARVAFTRAVAGVALLKIGIGLVAVAAALAMERGVLAPRHALYAALLIAYAGIGLLLLKAATRDERAALLGVTFLLVATAFADRLLGVWRGAEGVALTAARGVHALQVDAFMPYYLWSFAREFPQAPDDAPTRRRLAFAVAVTAVLGALLGGANVGAWVAARMHWTSLAESLFIFSRYDDIGPYWIAQFVCFLGALAVLQVRAVHARRDEARRAALLTAAIVAGTGPAVLYILLTASSSALLEILPVRRAGWLIYPLLLATPLASAYAVLVRHALDAGVVLRAAVRYAVSRYAVHLTLAVPLVLLAASLYAGRSRTITELVAARQVLLLAALSAVGVFVVHGRHGLLDRIDHRFFREQYDARHVLGELVDRCRRATSRRELERVLRVEIDRALHPDTVSVLFLDGGGAYTSDESHLRPLNRGSALAELLAASNTLLDIDLADERTRVARLPEPDRHWLVDGNVHLLVPLRDNDEQVIGLLALGEKRSELPYTREDRQLLKGVVAEAEMTIAYRQLQPSATTRAESGYAPDPDALECVECNWVTAGGVERCTRCGGPLTRAALPLIVDRKFRVERRLGAGGMGIVYRAIDLQLGRAVAIKTLPVVAPAEASELRREARAMAVVSHPNLAQIYGLETSRGRPMLVVEYLGGGTLTARLRRQTLSIEAAIDLGVGLASGLSALHDAGILHRDVKPSNIAFSREDVPKLLDFGLARLFSAVRQQEVSRRRAPSGRSSLGPFSLSLRASSMTQPGIVIGTPEYMSPEAVRGEPPDARFDLWSLCIVLYESISGTNPLARTRLYLAGPMVRRPPIPDIREYAADAPECVAVFFKRALSEEMRERPLSAAALIRALGELRDQVRSTV